MFIDNICPMAELGRLLQLDIMLVCASELRALYHFVLERTCHIILLHAHYVELDFTYDQGSVTFGSVFVPPQSIFLPFHVKSSYIII